MKVTVIKTPPIEASHQTLVSLLDAHIASLSESSIVVITSKVVSLCEGRVVNIEAATKEQLIRKEADYYLPVKLSAYGITLAMKNGMLIPSAGVDESNGHGHYILWPENPQQTANIVRQYLRERFRLNYVGAIITDSTTVPLRRGTMGVAIAHSGFLALRNYVGLPDIFGRKFDVTKANVRDALAASAVVVMGEGNEQTPLAVIDDVPFVEWQDRNPTAEELAELRIRLDQDLYAPLLQSVRWRVGGRARPWYTSLRRIFGLRS